MNRNGYGSPSQSVKYPSVRSGGRRKISTRHKVIMAVILVVYIAILSAITYFILYKPNTGGTDTFVEYATDEYGNRIEVTHEFNQREGVYNFLVLGEDREAMLTDVCMLFNFNVNDGSMRLLQIPRDTFVTSTDGVSIRSNKINELFSDHYSSRLRQGEGAEAAYKGALDDVTALIEDNLCIRINFSLIMDLDGFRNIVDAIGGVEINLPYELEYSDPEQNLYINLPQGYNNLDGERAEWFIRFRHDYIQGDLGRVNAQKIFITSFLNKLKSSISLSNTKLLGDLAGEIFDNVTTNLTVSDIAYFGKSLISMDLSNVTMQTLPGQVAQTSASHYVMNRAAALTVLNEGFNVYDKDITSGIFDTKGMFTNHNDPYISGLYYASADELYDGKVYTGDGVDGGEINIPMK